jgi:hypothetical protein
MEIIKHDLVNGIGSEKYKIKEKNKTYQVNLS